MTTLSTILWIFLGVAVVAGAIALLLARPKDPPRQRPVTELPRPAADAVRGAHNPAAPQRLSVTVTRRHWLGARRLARRDGVSLDDLVADLIDAALADDDATARQELAAEETNLESALSAWQPPAACTEGDGARPGDGHSGGDHSAAQGVPTPIDPLGAECWRGALIAVAEGGPHPGAVEGNVSGSQPVPGPRRDATHLDTGGNAEKMSITTDRQPYRCGDETPHPGPSVSPSRDGGGPGCASKFP